MTLPYVVFAVAVTGFFGNTLTAAMIAIGVLLAPRFYRIARAAGLGLTGPQYVEAAELFGASLLVDPAQARVEQGPADASR
jgi:peptide/nickel transport system permease protein